MTIACPDCGSVQELPVLPRRAIASCRSCHNTLQTNVGRSVTAALALSGGVLALLIPAYSLPFVSVTLMGWERTSYIGSAVVELAQTEWAMLAVGVALFAIVLPLTRFTLLTATLGAIRFGYRPPWLGRAFRWAVTLDLWAMQDVFLVGAFIGYTRVAADLTATVEPGGWCFLAAAGLSMVAHAALDRREAWRAIAADRPAPGGPTISCTHCDHVAPATAEGRPCPRCAATLHARKPNAVAISAALTVAGLILYLPANLYPMTVVIELGAQEGHVILYGVTRLLEAGLWPFAVVIFTASIVIPLAKLLGLSWFLLSIRFGWRWKLGLRTRLHRFIDDIGRWSNIDIFTIAVFVPLMQFGQIANARVGQGTAFFFAVVVITMVASQAFDPRLMWDAAERRRGDG